MTGSESNDSKEDTRDLDLPRYSPFYQHGGVAAVCELHIDRATSVLEGRRKSIDTPADQI